MHQIPLKYELLGFIKSWDSLEKQIREKNTFSRKNKKYTYPSSQNMHTISQWVLRPGEFCEIKVRNPCSEELGGLEGDSICRDAFFFFFLSSYHLPSLFYFASVWFLSLLFLFSFLSLTSLILPFSVLHPLPTLAIRQRRYHNPFSLPLPPLCILPDQLIPERNPITYQ